MDRKLAHLWRILLSAALFALAALSETRSPAVQAQDSYQEALARIQEAKETGATELGLVGMGLAELPPEIGQLTGLLELTLDGNTLTGLPPEIGQLTSLQTLDLANNNLTSLPPEIGQLFTLQALSLSGNPLESPPPEVVEHGTPAILEYLLNQLYTRSEE